MPGRLADQTATVVGAGPSIRDARVPLRGGMGITGVLLPVDGGMSVRIGQAGWRDLAAAGDTRRRYVANRDQCSIW